MSCDTRIQQYWQQHQVYKWNPSEGREANFIIDTPPPTVSGKLHIGHIFSYSHIDFIARFQRMCGKNVFYPIGFDDNGLPTERLVEKERGIKAGKMARAEFVAICREVVQAHEERFRELFKKMGYSFDWELEYQTISPQTSRISQISFLDLLQKGQIYRKDQPVLWDPVDQTALAQAEIEDKEKSSFMNDVIFQLEQGGSITIATTRPELLAACAAILVHPDDARYKNIVGSWAISPLFFNKIPIIADENVLIQKGSGAVMCCTFGDATDILWWQKHNLPTQIIINKQGQMVQINFDQQNSLNPILASENYAQLQGLKINAAREKSIELLKNAAVLTKQTPLQQVVKCAERSGAPLEILITPQWFIKTIQHKEKLLELSSQLNWSPHFMQTRLDNWIKGVSWDWCISRQRFFGVPFPVWYSKRKGEEGKVLLADIDKLPIDPVNCLPQGYSSDEVEPDLDVMDTWATSAVSPQINSLAINKNFAIDLDRHNKTFPADLRPQAHEIIRIWAFGTILKSYLHEQVLPWKNIMISGWCLAEDKSKMSKSKGNIIEPLSLLEKHGVDAIRYWASTAKPGHDTCYTEAVVLNGKKLVNKLLNAAKFCQSHFVKIDLKNFDINKEIQNKQIFCQSDLWILSKLDKIIVAASKAFENFEYCEAREVAETFFWRDFCDTYLELIKGRVYNDSGLNSSAQVSAIKTLYHTLGTVLKLLAPFLPYITEEINIDILQNNNSIHARGSWPSEINFIFSNCDSVEEIVFGIIENVRRAKTERNLSMKAPVALINAQITGTNISADLVEDLKNVTCANQLAITENSQAFSVFINFD